MKENERRYIPARERPHPRELPDAPTLRPGYWVAVTLPEGYAELRCFVGELQAVDERGIRLTLVDWLSGRATGNDLYLPHAAVLSMLVATPAHDLELFGEDARRWQAAMSPIPEPDPEGG